MSDEDKAELAHVMGCNAEMATTIATLRRALERADADLTCRSHCTGHYCPNCDRSLFDVQQRIRAALQGNSTEKEKP